MGGAIGAVALLMVSSFASHSPKLPIVLGVLGLLLLLFYALTVEIDTEQLRFWFGPGIIRKSIALQRIVSCKPVRNFWLCGWGIRWWGHGWLYNVSGFRAVELELDNGKRLRIGTEEPEELDRAIKQAIHQNSEFRTQDSE
jgi:hypothetical protein